MSIHSNPLDKEEDVFTSQEPSYLRFIEWILGSLILIGIALSLALAPGSNIILVLSTSLLILFYASLGFIFFNGIRVRKMFTASSYRGIGTGRLVGAVAAGFALSTGLTGILFKLMFWEGSHQMIKSGLYFMIPVFVVGIVKYLASNTSGYYVKIFIRLLIVGSIGLILMQLSWFDIKYRNHPELIKAFHQYNDHRTEENRLLLEQERSKVLDKH